MSAVILWGFQSEWKLPMNEYALIIVITLYSLWVIWTFINHTFRVVVSFFMCAQIWFRSSAISQRFLPEHIPTLLIFITFSFFKTSTFQNSLLFSIMCLIMCAFISWLLFLIFQWLLPEKINTIWITLTFMFVKSFTLLNDILIQIIERIDMGTLVFRGENC